MRKPGRGTKRVTWADREEMLRRWSECHNAAQVGREMGLNEKTVRSHLKLLAVDPATEEAVEQAIPRADVPPPQPWASLSEDQRYLLDNFRAFRRRYFKRETPWFQDEVAARIEDEDEPAQVILLPPGHGKSTLCSHDWVVWKICRERALKRWFSCLYVAKAAPLAENYVSRVRRTLENNRQLQMDFGRFKPRDEGLWRTDRFLVDGFTQYHDEKEPTLMAAGYGSAIYSLRMTLVMVDDLVDEELSRTPEAVDRVYSYFTNTLESRINAGDGGLGGRLVYVGTKWSPHDLPGRLERLVDDETGEPMYRFTVFKAHDTTRCRLPVGPDGKVMADCTCRGPCAHHPAQPEGCTLWPQRQYWRPKHSRDWVNSLRLRRLKDPRGFEFMFNQTAVAAEGALVAPEDFEAALDRSHAAWEFPEWSQVFCSVDPSGGSGFAVFQCWAFQRHTGHHHLVAQVRDRVSVPAYLSIMESWTLRIRQAGHEPVWIIEENMARFMTQSTDFSSLRLRLGGLRVIHHWTTGRNKHDPSLGVPMIGPLFAAGRVSVAAGSPDALQQARFLGDELCAWTPTATGTTDCVMAMWFYTCHVGRQARAAQPQFLPVAGMPPYLAARRRLVPLGIGMAPGPGEELTYSGATRLPWSPREQEEPGQEWVP